MDIASSTGAASSNGASNSSNANEALRGLDVSEFLNLMIAELQNQDPLNPMENSEILQQISQIREIDSSEKLTKTLDAVRLGQSLSSASSMIGKVIRGLGEDNRPVTGTVDRISIADGVPKLHVGEARVQLTKIGEIHPAGTELDPPTETESNAS